MGGPNDLNPCYAVLVVTYCLPHQPSPVIVQVMRTTVEKLHRGCLQPIHACSVRNVQGQIRLVNGLPRNMFFMSVSAVKYTWGQNGCQQWMAFVGMIQLWIWRWYHLYYSLAIPSFSVSNILVWTILFTYIPFYLYHVLYM